MIEVEHPLGDEAGALRPLDHRPRHEVMDVTNPPPDPVSSAEETGSGDLAGGMARPKDPPQPLAQVDGHPGSRLPRARPPVGSVHGAVLSQDGQDMQDG
jgi:hypothetical protein